MYSTALEVRAAFTARNSNASLPTTCPRPRLFAVRRQRSPASMGSLFINQRACHYRGAPEVDHVANACFFFGRHVASPPVVIQPARVQCASRSFTKVFVGRRLAPLHAPGKYRWSSSACFVRSSATLTVMASPNHPRCSQACSAKYGAGSRAAALPNPSVKLSANGVPHWPPSAGPVAHFALAVQRATPLAPAYLER